MAQPVARLWAFALSALMGITMAGCSVFGGRAADEPAYIVVRSDGDFEIRDYPAMVVATTVVEAPRGQAVGTGFGRLFDYISGANTGAAKIAMTAPVLTTPTKLAMTAPVLTSDGPGGWQTSFILPAGTTLATAPQPTDPGVTLAEIPARRVAVVKFSGVLSGPAQVEPQARLAAWATAQGLSHAGDWRAAGYNPPWTIPALRRNEIMVTLTDPA